MGISAQRGGGGQTLKLKLMMTLFFKVLTGNKFALIQVSMMRMCNKIKTKAYTSCACFIVKSCSINSRNLCSLNINVNTEDLLTFFKQCEISFQMIYTRTSIYPIVC